MVVNAFRALCPLGRCGAGSKEPVMNVDIAKRFIKAGADVILVPAVGTVPGFTDRAR